MKITEVESNIVHCQDTSEGMSDKENVGGYTGYQVLVRIRTDEGIEGWRECHTGGTWARVLLPPRC